MDGQVIERVMRMGIEGRVHSVDKLFDLARKQLKARGTGIIGDEKAWRANEHRLAFMYVNNVLQIVRVPDLVGIKIVEWRSSSMPLVAKLH